MQSEIIFTHSSYLLHYFSITVLDLEQRKKYLNCFHLNYTYLFLKSVCFQIWIFFPHLGELCDEKDNRYPTKNWPSSYSMQKYERWCIYKKLIEVGRYISIAIKVNLLEFLFTQLSFEHSKFFPKRQKYDLVSFFRKYLTFREPHTRCPWRKKYIFIYLWRT